MKQQTLALAFATFFSFRSGSAAAIPPGDLFELSQRSPDLDIIVDWPVLGERRPELLPRNGPNGEESACKAFGGDSDTSCFDAMVLDRRDDNIPRPPPPLYFANAAELAERRG